MTTREPHSTGALDRLRIDPGYGYSSQGLRTGNERCGAAVAHRQHGPAHRGDRVVRRLAAIHHPHAQVLAAGHIHGTDPTDTPMPTNTHAALRRPIVGNAALAAAGLLAWSAGVPTTVILPAALIIGGAAVMFLVRDAWLH